MYNRHSSGKTGIRMLRAAGSPDSLNQLALGAMLRLYINI